MSIVTLDVSAGGTFSDMIVAEFSSLGVRPGSIGLGFRVQSLRTDDRRMAKMAQQVKDVLPHVPLSVITKDLGMTPGNPLSSVIYLYLLFTGFLLFVLPQWDLLILSADLSLLVLRSHVENIFVIFQTKPIVWTPP